MPKLSQKEFYEKYYPLIVKHTKGTGLHPEAVIAQMAIESGWGGSGLTEKHNAFFGIKSHGEGGVTMETEEERDGVRGKEDAEFRVYKDAEDSIKGYIKFVQENPRYKKAGVFDSKTPEEQGYAFQKAGYATSSRYGDDIKKTIKSNDKYIQNIPAHKEYLDSASNPNIEGYNPNWQSAPDTRVTAQSRADVTPSPQIIQQGNKQYFVDGQGGVFKSPSGSDEFTDEDMADIEAFMDEVEKNGYPTENKFTPLPDSERKSLNDFIDKGDFSTLDNKGNLLRKGPSIKDIEPIKKAITGGKMVDKPTGDMRRGETQTIDKPRERPPQEPFRPNIHDINEATDPVSTDPESIKSMDDIDAIRSRLEKNENLLADLKRKEPFDDTYAPDEQGRDLAGYLTDVGRGVLGVAGATEEIPRYSPSRIFNLATQEAEARRNLGLSPEEIGFRKQMAERGYGYDVKNIRRLAGGSAGVALGNLGRATGQLQDQYSAIGAEDEAVRRQNRAIFTRQADKAEMINRQIFEDDLNQAMMSKQAAAGLVSDSISNIKSRADYERAYGPGSPYHEYQKELVLDKRHSRQMLDEANLRREEEYFNELSSNIDADKKLMEKLTGNYTSLDGSEKPALFKNTEPTTALSSGVQTDRLGMIEDGGKSNALNAALQALDPNDPEYDQKAKSIEHMLFQLGGE